MTVMVQRERHLRRLRELLDDHPALAILGARQVGKTTIAREIAASFPGDSLIFDLEDPGDLARLSEPMLALGGHDGLIILDEVQRRPDLFAALRVLIDRVDVSARFLVLGSASPNLLRQTSESLAGRIVYHELGGFAVDEVGMDKADHLWLRGGFPRSFLARSDRSSNDWRRSFIQTFLERDLPALGIQVPGITLQRFWRMLAHYHGQLWNGAELGRAFGVAATTVRSYLDLLTSALVLRQLQPWHENLSKRQVKSPKVYVADSGLLHGLLGLDTREDLEGHPKVGASWEGFVLQELLLRLGARQEEAFFWATHAGAELDLLIVRGNRRLGFEIKRTTSPRVTRSMRSAIESLRLDRLDIVHAGAQTFPLSEQVRALAFSRILKDLSPLS